MAPFFTVNYKATIAMVIFRVVCCDIFYQQIMQIALDHVTYGAGSPFAMQDPRQFSSEFERTIGTFCSLEPAEFKVPVATFRTRLPSKYFFELGTGRTF